MMERGLADEEPLSSRDEQSAAIIAAARRLIAQKGDSFTTQELIKEAGVALNTFYRRFAGKDQLLVAAIKDLITERCASLESQARPIPDPVERLKLYVKGTLGSISPDDGPRFITSEHWRLHQLFPDDMALATKPYSDLIQRALDTARSEGLLAPADPERAAWLITKLVMSAYHHYAFHPTDPRVHTVADDVWWFCLSALGGTTRRTKPHHKTNSSSPSSKADMAPGALVKGAARGRG